MLTYLTLEFNLHCIVFTTVLSYIDRVNKIIRLIVYIQCIASMGVTSQGKPTHKVSCVLPLVVGSFYQACEQGHHIVAQFLCRQYPEIVTQRDNRGRQASDLLKPSLRCDKHWISALALEDT